MEGGRDTGVLRGLSLYTLVPVPRVVTWNPTVTIPSPWIYPPYPVPVSLFLFSFYLLVFMLVNSYQWIHLQYWYKREFWQGDYMVLGELYTNIPVPPIQTL